MTTPVRFLHISDTHFGPTRDLDYHGRSPYQDSVRLVNEINSMPVSPDFVIHTGDVVNEQDPAAYACASEVLSKIKCPLYFATGNHDDPKLLNNFPLFSKRTPLVARNDAVSYHFEFGQYLFITVDAKNSDDNDPSGILSDDQISALSALLEKTSKQFIVFTHFPALPIDAPWMDGHLLIKNGQALHDILKKYPSRCLGVLFGHLHQPLQIFADGILYVGAPSATFQFGGWPTDIDIPSYNPRGTAGINLVTLIGSRLIVKYISLPAAL